MRNLFCALALAGAALADAPTAIALRGARVVTVSGPTLERGTVLLRGGLIEAVGVDAAIPADAWVIEAAGLTVYPGLIDALTVMAPPGAPGPSAASGTRPAAAPATAARSPQDRPGTTSWLRAADAVNAGERRLEDSRNAGFTSAVVFPGGGIFSGQGAVVNTAGEKRRMIVAAPAGQYCTLSYRNAGFPGSLMGVIAYVRQVYLDAEHYREHRSAWERQLPGIARPDYDRALEGLLESPRLLLPAGGAVELDRMARLSAGLSTKVVLYGGEGGYRVAGELARAGLPVLVNLKWPEKPREADPDEPEPLRTLELRERAPSTPAAFLKARVPFAFYAGGTAARDIPRAVRRALDAGLPEDAAVRAFTLGAAEIYGVAGILGSVEKGKIANLAVTDGPLFGEKTKLKYVFVDGVKFEPPPSEAPAAAPAGGDR